MLQELKSASKILALEYYSSPLPAISTTWRERKYTIGKNKLTEWLRKPAIGIKQVLSFPSVNIIFMLLEYQSSQAHKNCSHLYCSGGNTSGWSLHRDGNSSSYCARKCCRNIIQVMPGNGTHSKWEMRNKALKSVNKPICIAPEVQPVTYSNDIWKKYRN